MQNTKIQVNQDLKRRGVGLQERQRAHPPEPARTCPPWKSPGLMNPGYSPTRGAMTLCLQVWPGSTVSQREPGSLGGRFICSSLSGHILPALGHSSCSLQKAGELPSFRIKVLLNHLGKPLLDFHMCVYKAIKKKKNTVVAYATERQSFIKKTGTNSDHRGAGVA